MSRDSKPWKCEVCGSEYAEYINGCPHCWNAGLRSGVVSPAPQPASGPADAREWLYQRGDIAGIHSPENKPFFCWEMTNEELAKYLVTTLTAYAVDQLAEATSNERRWHDSSDANRDAAMGYQDRALGAERKLKAAESAYAACTRQDKERITRLGKALRYLIMVRSLKCEHLHPGSDLSCGVCRAEAALTPEEKPE